MLKAHRYNTWAVIRATICPSKPLDMNCDAGKELLAHARKEIIKRVSLAYYNDQHVIKHLIKRLNFDVLVFDFLIQLTKQERIRNLWSKFPNVRVICVFQPNTAIDKASIVVVRDGPVEET